MKARRAFALRTPSSVSPDVRRLCELIRPGVEPIFLRVAPDVDSAASNCFANVQRKVAREGGMVQHGWAIWIWPRVFIEAEHHAVHAPVRGPLRDITPAASPGIKRRLFLPDDAAVADISDRQGRRDNVRLALTDDPLLAEVFAGAIERTRVWRREADTGAVEQADVNRLQAAELTQVNAQRRLAMKYSAPNDPCFCGSAKRFKQCHGRR